MSGQLAAAILAAPGSFARGGEEKVAIIAARRLPVAALSALLLNEPGYRLVQEAHRTTEGPGGEWCPREPYVQGQDPPEEEARPLGEPSS